MNILVFSDIHGSLNSLKALVKTDDWKRADKRIFLGDVCIGCSRPNECIELLKQLDCEKIIGNNDVYVCDHVPKVDLCEFAEEKIEMLKYMQKIVTRENKKYVMSWQKALTLKLYNKILYFTHYVWENYNNDENVIDTPREKSFDTRKQMFKDIEADFIFFGHEHRENHFSNGKQYFYCVGTLGLRSPGYYLKINIDKNKVEINEHYVEFDINEEIDLMDKAGYPYERNKIKKS